MLSGVDRQRHTPGRPCNMHGKYSAVANHLCSPSTLQERQKYHNHLLRGWPRHPLEEVAPPSGHSLEADPVGDTTSSRRERPPPELVVVVLLSLLNLEPVEYQRVLLGWHLPAPHTLGHILVGWRILPRQIVGIPRHCLQDRGELIWKQIRTAKYEWSPNGYGVHTNDAVGKCHGAFEQIR